MKIRPAILIAAATGGLAVGWLLPAPSSEPVAGAAVAPVSTASAARSRHLRREELLAGLLPDGLLIRHHREGTTLAGLLGSMRENGNTYGVEIERMVEMDPASAMAQLLNDPVLFHCARDLAEEWARRDPIAAVRFLSRQSCYAAESCLCKALVACDAAAPRLVGETLRAKGRRWQARNLEELFTQTASVLVSPPTRVRMDSEDPFADDGSVYRTVNFGEEILDCLADDELRERARSYWKSQDDKDKRAVPNQAPAPLPAPPEEDSAEAAAKGNYEVRERYVTGCVNGFPYDRAKWPAALKELEEMIAKREVVPRYPPRHFEQGPFLSGAPVAEWIARQPLALQRAWSATFTETWARSESEAALNWARALPPGANGDVAMQNGLIVWAHEQPEEAARYVAALPPGDLREAAISNTAATWSCLDPAGAKRWLATLPESPGKTRGLGRVK